MSEIDSFIWKFKKLLHSGKNAHLDIKSETGKAIVKLTAEVDVLPQHQHQHRVQSRNGPSQQRRREKRAAARLAAAAAAVEVTQDVDSSAVEQVAEETSTENITQDKAILDVAVKAKVVLAEEDKNIEAGKAVVEEVGKPPTTEEVIDEMCSNETYNKAKSITTTSQSVTPSSTSSRRLAGFDYYSLKYPSDSE